MFTQVDAGTIIVTYFDLRCAMAARGALHGTLMCGKPLDISFSRSKSDTQDPYGLSQLHGNIVVYNLDPNTNNETLGNMFSQFGQVAGVSQDQERPSQKVGWTPTWCLSACTGLALGINT